MSRGKINVQDEDRKGAMILKQRDMNPQSLCLKIGQRFVIEGRKDNGDKYKKSVELRKFYKNHVLCKVNGIRTECFTYNQLSQLAQVRKGIQDGF